VNLILADIAKIKPIPSAIMNKRVVSVFIYSHTITLNIMREIVRGELLRPGILGLLLHSFLYSIREKKKELKQMFTCDRDNA